MSGLGELSRRPVVYVGVCSRMSGNLSLGSANSLSPLLVRALAQIPRRIIAQPLKVQRDGKPNLDAPAETFALSPYNRSGRTSRTIRLARLTKHQHHVKLSPTLRFSSESIFYQLRLHLQPRGIWQRILEHMVPDRRESSACDGTFARARCAGVPGRSTGLKDSDACREHGEV